MVVSWHYIIIFFLSVSYLLLIGIKDYGFTYFLFFFFFHPFSINPLYHRLLFWFLILEAISLWSRIVWSLMSVLTGVTVLMDELSQELKDCYRGACKTLILILTAATKKDVLLPQAMRKRGLRSKNAFFKEWRLGWEWRLGRQAWQCLSTPVKRRKGAQGLIVRPLSSSIPVPAKSSPVNEFAIILGHRRLSVKSFSFRILRPSIQEWAIHWLVSAYRLSLVHPINLSMTGTSSLSNSFWKLFQSWDWWCTKGKVKVNRFYDDFYYLYLYMK